MEGVLRVQPTFLISLKNSYRIHFLTITFLQLMQLIINKQLLSEILDNLLKCTNCGQIRTACNRPLIYNLEALISFGLLAHFISIMFILSTI